MLTGNAHVKGYEEVSISKIDSELRQERNVITIRNRRKINKNFMLGKENELGIDSLKFLRQSIHRFIFIPFTCWAIKN